MPFSAFFIIIKKETHEEDTSFCNFTFNKCWKQQLDPKLIFATNVFITDEKVKMPKAARSNKALYKLVDYVNAVCNHEN